MRAIVLFVLLGLGIAAAVWGLPALGRPAISRSTDTQLATSARAETFTITSATAPLGLAPVVAFSSATRVWIIVVDGPRRSETWDLPGRPHIPRQAALAAQSTIYHDFRNEGETLTNPGHVAMITGRWESPENSSGGRMQQPGLFQRYRRQTAAPATAAMLITSKDKLWLLSDCADPEWQGKWRPFTDCGKRGDSPMGGYRSDVETQRKVMAAITAPDPPHLMLVNFLGPDAAGHSNDWPGYLAAIRATDGYVGEIIDTVMNNPIVRATTTVFVTNDHGRHLNGHADGFISHGDDCAGCRAITLQVFGPHVAGGREIKQRRSQVDLAVTAAGLLEVTLPNAVGKPMVELFYH